MHFANIVLESFQFSKKKWSLKKKIGTYSMLYSDVVYSIQARFGKKCARLIPDYSFLCTCDYNTIFTYNLFKVCKYEIS